MSSLLKHTFGLLFVFGFASVADAVTARPGVVQTGKVASVSAAGRRMPTIAAAITNTTTTTSNTTSSLLDDTKCVDEYLTCIKAPEVCGSGFEECTTRVLFHTMMPQCISTLYQCSSGGINRLFGTSDMNALSRVATTNEYDEVTDYTYPTDSSALGQLITAGAISNMYSTSDCVRRYTTCLNRENVCGTDFELCTSYNEFKKQRVGCDSVLARCQGEGLKELFGTASRTATPTDDSRIGTMIVDGATLAAINAVSTCYRVTDQCMLNACSKNPYKCYENTPAGIVEIVNSITGTNANTSLDEQIETVIDKKYINKYIRSECMDTIGQNKYCYATFIGNGKMPTNSELRDEFNQEDVFSQAYSTRMNSGMVSKVADMVNEFDTEAKSKCTETIRSCAMRVCGGGSGAACYKLASTDGINGTKTYTEIQNGCAAIVNTDPNCIYAAQNVATTGKYTYTFNANDTFETLFTKGNTDTNADPIGVIAGLNATLNTSYNDAAIAQMKKQCQTQVTNCVKTMCGTDYINCYRNRTDIMSNLTNTSDSDFNDSMNKVGGVLDYTIILGLCVNTVKNSDVCAEHLAIEKAKIELTNSDYTSSWGTDITDTTVRSGWYDAGAATNMTPTSGVKKTNDAGEEICTNNSGSEGVCDGVNYTNPVYISVETYVQDLAANTLFKELVYDLEKEAQAKYNAKLTKEQNMCLSSNSGGILGNGDTGSTYMWVKLKNNKSVPKNYAISGLKSDDFVASNDLYGSFCRIRVTLQSNDKYIQDKIKDEGTSWSQAYFALGDTFTCGSWLSADDLEELAQAAGKDARIATGLEDENGNDTNKAKRQKWWTTIATSLAAGTGGAFLGDSIAKGNALPGLTGNKQATNARNSNINIRNCKNYAEQAAKFFGDTNNSATSVYRSAWETAVNNANIAVQYAQNANIPTAIYNNVTSATGTLLSNAAIWGYNPNSDTQISNNTAAEAAASAASAALNNLVTACQGENITTTQDNKNWFQNWGGAVTIGAGTALAGGVATYYIVQSAHDTQLDAAEQEAYQEFMDNIGSKIRCFIGADEVGQYGDMISAQME